jgi:hypothetical protein
MTAPHVNRFLKPLLKNNPEFGQVNRELVLKPLHHIYRCVALGTSSSKDWLRPRWIFMPLFEVTDCVHLTYAADIYPFKPGNWYYSDETAPEHFVTCVNEVALPVLNLVQSIADFYHLAMQKDYFRSGGLYYRPLARVLVEAAMGDFAAADITSAQLRAVPNEWSSNNIYDDQYERSVHQLCPLIAARDRAGIAALLHGWEAEMVKRLKLEKYWERTPFPIELEK